MDYGQKESYSSDCPACGACCRAGIPYLDGVSPAFFSSILTSGVSAVAVWAAMHALGADGLRKIVAKLMAHKAMVLSTLAGLSVQSVTHPDSLTVGLMFPTLPGGRLPLWIEEKYWLYAGHTKSYGMKGVPPRMYKVFFLPHMTGSVVRMFVRDVLAAVGAR